MNQIQNVIATRQNMYAWYKNSFNYLANPDEVLKRLGYNISIYKELLYDPHVKSCIQSRKAGTLKMKWSIDRKKYDNIPDITSTPLSSLAPESTVTSSASSVSIPTSSASKNLSNFIEEIFNTFDMPRIFSEMLDAPLYGYKICEILWQVVDGKIVPIDIIGKPPEWFYFDQNNLLHFGLVSLNNSKLLPTKKFFVVQSESTYDNPYGESILARCYKPVIFKRETMQRWMTFSEKYGMPYLVGKVPSNTSKTQKDNLLDSLDAAREDTVAVIEGDETTVEILDGTHGSSSDIFKSLIELSNGEISKAILSQTLTTDQVSQGGSNALGKTHWNVKDEVIKGDKRIIEYWFNRLITWIVELNIGKMEDMPKFELYEEEDVDQAQATVTKTLTDTGQIKFKAPYWKKYFYLDDEDFEVINGIHVQTPPAFAESEMSVTDKYGLSKFSELTQKVLKPVLEMIDCGKDYSDIQDMIVEQFPGLDTSVMLTRIRRI